VDDEAPVADGEFRSGGPGSGDPVAPAPRRRRRRLSWGLLAVVLVAALAAAAVLGVPGLRPWEGRAGTPRAVPSSATPSTSPPPTSSAPASSPSATVSAAPPERPTAGGATTRLGAPPVPPPGGGAHAFALLQENGVSPVAYDPCRQIHYVIRPDQAPAGGEELVHAVVARLAETTGLQFVYDGPTDEALSDDRPPFQPDLYGDRWAPVLVAWQTPEENPTLAGDIVGEGGSNGIALGTGPRIYVTGSVSLDSGQFPSILERRDGAEIAKGIMLHEFGHVLGLDHVDDDDQLMYPETNPGVVDFAAGDLEGLARLGRGPCVPEL